MQRERRAVSALFLSNGAALTVVPRLPELKAALELTDGQLGRTLLGLGLGGLAGSALSRSLLPRVGSRRLAVGAALVLGALLPVVALAPSAGLLLVVLAAIGLCDALMDVGMNVSGIAVQRRLERPVLSGLHALWSVGAVVAGAVGSVAAGLRVPLVVHLSAVGLALALVALAAAHAVPDDDGVGSGERRAGRFSRPLALLCLLAVLAALLEDAPASWSAVYLSEHVGAAPGVAGLGFTAFMAAMVGGRLVGDRVVARHGLVRVVRWGGLAAAVALAAGLLLSRTAAGVPAGVAAFAVVGFGAAALFPALFTAAGALPGQGVAVMNAASRVGFLASPPVVGAVADVRSLPVALGLLVVPAALGIGLLAGAVRPGETTGAAVASQPPAELHDPV